MAVSSLMREILIRLAEADNRDNDMKLLLAGVWINEISLGESQPLSLPIPDDPRIARLALHLQTNPADQATLRLRTH